MKFVSEMHDVNKKHLRTLFLLELSYEYEVCALAVQKGFAYEYSHIFLLGKTTVDDISSN